MSFTVTDCQTVFPTLPRPRSLSQSRVRDVMVPSLPSRGKHPHLPPSGSWPCARKGRPIAACPERCAAVWLRR